MLILEAAPGLLRMLRRSAALGLALCGAVLGGTAVPPLARTAEEVAYFQFDYPPAPETFVIALTDPAQIQAARDMLAGRAPMRHVMGVVVKEPANYNPPWRYHLDPASIRFFSFAVEVCDASITMVEQQLDEVGGTFLPGSVWCPWGSRLLAELLAPPGPTATPTGTPTVTPTSTAAAPVRLLLPLLGCGR